MARKYAIRTIVVAIAVLTVLGTTAAPAMASSTQSGGNDCDLVDVDGSHNTVSVDLSQENSDFNINCGGSGGNGGTSDSGASNADTSNAGAENAGGAASTSTTKVDVNVNGEHVSTSRQQSQTTTQEQQQQQQQTTTNGAEENGPGNQETGQGSQENGPGNQEAGPGSQENGPGNQEAGPGSQENGPGNQEAGPGSQENGPGDQNQESGNGSQENGPGDQTNGGPGDDVVQNFNADDLVQFFTTLNFIDQSELNAAIANGNISNSTIVTNIVNGDQTINMNSRFVDNSVTIDNSTTITTVINNIIDNSTVVNNSTLDNSTVNNGGNAGGGNQTGNGTGGGGMAAPDISVTKSADNDTVELSLLNSSGDLLQADESTDFTVTVTNEGNDTARNVVVNDDDVIADIGDLTSTTAFLVSDSTTSQGDFSAVTGDFDVGTLQPGDSATLTFSALAVSTDARLLDPTVAQINATNVASLDSVNPADSNASNDVGTEELTLVSVLPLAAQENSTASNDTGPSVQSVNTPDNASGANATNATESTTGNASAALGSPSTGGFAVGGLGLMGVLGSILLFRRRRD